MFTKQLAKLQCHGCNNTDNPAIPAHVESHQTTIRITETSLQLELSWSPLAPGAEEMELRF